MKHFPYIGLLTRLTAHVLSSRVLKPLHQLIKWALYHKPRGLAVTVLLAGGCAPAHDNDYSDYSQRIARSLELDATVQALAYQPSSGPTWAKQSSTQQSLNIIEFLRLTGCDLQFVVGEKNSGLGKHAPASVQLINTLAFLSSAPQCEQQLRNNEQTNIADKLAAAIATKTQQLGLYIGAATIAGPEFKQFWTNPTPANYPHTTNDAVIVAINQLNQDITRWISGDFSADISRLEQQLFSIKHGDGGALLHQLQQTDHALVQANQFIQQRLDGPPLCFKERPSNQFKIFNNVVTQYFVTDIQATSVKAKRRSEALFTAVNELEQRLSQFETKAYQQWRLQRQASIQQAYDANKRHVGFIKKLWQQCGHDH